MEVMLIPPDAGRMPTARYTARAGRRGARGARGCPTAAPGAGELRAAMGFQSDGAPPAAPNATRTHPEEPKRSAVGSYHSRAIEWLISSLK